MDKLLSTEAAARVLGISPHTLIDWRRTNAIGAAPLPWTRIGRRVFYHECDLARLREARSYPSGSQPHGAAPYPQPDAATWPERAKAA